MVGFVSKIFNNFTTTNEYVTRKRDILDFDKIVVLIKNTGSNSITYKIEGSAACEYNDWDSSAPTYILSSGNLTTGQVASISINDAYASIFVSVKNATENSPSTVDVYIIVKSR